MLALERAQEVAQWLISEGVDANIIEISSHGEENPVVPTKDEVAEPKNRRVEVNVR
jgi:outer membrane protein OmpA-like peptidoglycan-associated protein